MWRHITLISTGAALAGVLLGIASGGGAQTVDGLDLAKVRARAKLAPADAEAFATTVARRGEALQQQATETAATARASSSSYARANKPSADPATTFDFDAMVAASAMQMTPEDAPRLVAFASLSMPAASLKAMIADVSKAGGVVVFRGLPGNSARTFTAALAKVLPAGEVRAVGIDPRLFRGFAVDAVPAYVVTATDFDLCDGFDCRTTLPPHDRIDGNVTLAHALDSFVSGNGPGARVAAIYRARLGGDRL